MLYISKAQQARFELIILLTLWGCGTTSPEVVGGTASQRMIVEEVLSEFREASSFVPKISRIQIQEYEVGGRYSTVNRSIRLNGLVLDDRLRKNARHELCHAYDFQLPFHSASSMAWGEGSDRDRREEFADVCSFGPESLSAIASCHEGALVSEIARLNEEVFDRIPLLTASLDAYGSFQLNSGEEVWEVQATDDGFLRIFTNQDVYKLDFDGTPAESGQGSQIPGYPQTDRESFGPWLFSQDPWRIGNREAEIASWHLSPDLVLHQALVVDGERLVSATCSSPEDQVFIHQEAFWLARQEAALLSWRPLGVALHDRRLPSL